VDSDGPGAGAATLKTRFLLGDAVDQVLAQETVTGNEVLWLLQDNLGSVRETVKNDGTVNSRVDFDPFGNMVSIIDPSSGGAATTLKTRLNFTGQEWDADLKLVWYSDGTGRGRWYDPATGTFISEDPLGFLAGDANLYRYVENGATYAVDPSGLVGQTATLPAGLAAHIARMLSQAAKISPAAYDKAAREALALVATLYGMSEAGQYMSQVSGRCLDDILNNDKVFDRWLKHKFPADKPFSDDDACKIWEKLKQRGKNPRLDDGHPGTKWPGKHINVPGPGGAHIPVDPGFIPPS
jgi:RHS repeat-associated protein